MMKALLESVEKLKQSEVRKLVDARLREFEGIGNKPSTEIFKELCFCILTANFNAEKSMKIQKDVGDGFLVLSESQLSRELSNLGHRYPSARAKYIVEARRYKDTIKEIIRSFKDENPLREWLVENVSGIGYKEASHFLRNIGYKNYAIIDFHIIDILTRYKLIEKLRSPTKGKYLEIEKLLKEIARKLDLSLAELDLYLWFIETGKILK
mgnify:FL=1